MIRYLTGVTSDSIERSDLVHLRRIDLLVQPGNSYHDRVDLFYAWAGDNGAFTTIKGGFSPERFRIMLSQPQLLRARARCRFISAPDKLVVHANGSVTGDAIGTLNQFIAWACEIRGLGYPVALVAQDGLELLLDRVPWHMVDTLFIGGSTEWKLSSGAWLCAQRALRMQKHVHMGRVNSYKRLSLANSWGIHTADGTFLKYGPTQNIPRLRGWLDRVEREPHAHLSLWRNQWA